MISLYIHIPFCVRKCLYCDFLSGFSSEYIPTYMSALYKEISAFKTDKKIKSVFIGGGTPSSVEPKYIAALMDILAKNYTFADNCEISMEANPCTLSEQKLDEYKKTGINRLSIGVQSFDDRLLRILGRVHDSETAKKNITLAKKYFENINLDLMFALPEQSLKDWQKTLETAVYFEPEHISAYSLIIEEGTPFYEKYEPIDESLDREMYYKAKEFLAQNGYKQYEISNFAKQGFECRHNLVYWQGGDYKGFGLGAASLVNSHRLKNTEDIREYINGTAVTEDIFLDKEDKMKEFVILGLRCTDGISKAEFKNLFDADIYTIFGEAIKNHSDLLIINGDNIRFNEKGIDLSNILFTDII